MFAGRSVAVRWICQNALLTPWIPPRRSGEPGFLAYWLLTPWSKSRKSGNPQNAFLLLEATMKRLSNKFGLMNEFVLPQKWQLKLQALTTRYLNSCAQMFKQWASLIQANATEEELERIAGGDVNFPRSPEEIQGEFDVTLFFDARDLDFEFVWKKLEAMVKWAVPLDRTGRIKMGQLTEFVMRAIDDTLANALVGDETTANQMMFKEVKDALVGMYAGLEPDYVENDPGAGQKLQFLKQLLWGNAENGEGMNLEMLEALGALPNGDPSKVKHRFRELVDRYTQNLEMSVKQQRNVMVGKLGVQAEGPQ
jgi:hypothetical protein